MFSANALSAECVLSPKNGPVPAVVFAPVPRETGIGFDRHRACRWIRALDGYDATGRNRGAVVWMMVGEDLLPGAVWADFGLSDPEAIVKGDASQVLQPVLLETVAAITRGCFLLEAGSRYFSYRPGATVDLGALVGNASRREQSLTVQFQATTAAGEVVFEKTASLDIPAGERQETRCQWTLPHERTDQFPYTVAVQLRAGDHVADHIEHRIDLLAPRKAGPQAFVRVEGSQFKLGGKPWYMLGMNYWPNCQGGRATVPYFHRAYYDPELIERDLACMQSMGINLLSGIQLRADVEPARTGRLSRSARFCRAMRSTRHEAIRFLAFVQSDVADQSRGRPATDRGKLLVAEGFDGVEAGGFDGRVHAEDEADAHGDGDGEDDGPKRDGRGKRRNSQIDEQADGNT